MRTALLLALVASSAHASIVWRSGFETGDLSEWSKAQVVAPDRLLVQKELMAWGSQSLKVTVKQGDNPINASGNRNEVLRMTNEPTGSEYWYRFNIFFDPKFPSVKTWQLFCQFHHSGLTGSPPLELFVYGEQIRMNVGGKWEPVWTAPLVRGKWQEVVLHVQWSPDPRVGFVEVYLNGKQALPITHGATQYAGQLNYLKMGLYRNATIAPVGILYLDEVIMGTSPSDVLRAPKPDAGMVADAGIQPKPDAGVLDAGVKDPLIADAGSKAPLISEPDAGLVEITPDAGKPFLTPDAGTVVVENDAGSIGAPTPTIPPRPGATASCSCNSVDAGSFIFALFMALWALGNARFRWR